MSPIQTKPHILLIATGGTIASTKHKQGLKPTLDGREICRLVPQLNDLAQISVCNLMQMDSTNVGPAEWVIIAKTIQDAYEQFDGFVVLHGTDTMGYTAAGLSYLIQNSYKPIVLTGSQQPMQAALTDARFNLYHAVQYACSAYAYNVSVVFGEYVIAGTRAHKQKTMSYNAFTSVNFPPLAKIRGNTISWETSLLELAKRSTGRTTGGIMGETPGCVGGAPSNAGGTTGNAGGATSIADAKHTTPATDVHFYTNTSSNQGLSAQSTALNPRVMAVRLTPGLTPIFFEALAPHYDALILEAFGIGGIPEHDSFSYKNAIDRWISTGHTLVLTTQVQEEGLDLGVYQVGQAYAQNPAILKADDMTPEALVAKTMWVLATAQNDPVRMQELFYTPINYDRLPRQNQ